MAEAGSESGYDIRKIMALLPHRYPMLLVDRIIEVIPGKSCRAIKNVTINEEFFVGHYPGLPVMPGVLILEAMAQAGAALLLTDSELTGLVPLLGAIDNVKFRRQVIPGDVLTTDAELLWFRNSVGKLKATSSVDGQEVATMETTFKLISAGGPSESGS